MGIITALLGIQRNITDKEKIRDRLLITDSDGLGLLPNTSYCDVSYLVLMTNAVKYKSNKYTATYITFMQLTHSVLQGIYFMATHELLQY